MASRQIVVLCWDFTPFLGCEEGQCSWVEGSRGGEPLDFIYLVSFTVIKTSKATCFQCFGLVLFLAGTKVNIMSPILGPQRRS